MNSHGIFFRSSSLESGALYLDQMLHPLGKGLHIQWDPMLISIIGLFIISDIVFRNRGFDQWIASKIKAARNGDAV